MEPSGVGVNALLHILHSLLVVVLHAGDCPSGPGQADDHPFAANSADTGGTQLLHVLAGADVRLADLSKGLQHGKLCLCRFQGVQILYQKLLNVRQGIKRLSCRLDLFFRIQGDLAQSFDQIHNRLGLFPVLRSGRQIGVGLFRRLKGFEVSYHFLLGRGQGIVGFSGRLNGRAAGSGDGADLGDQVLYILYLFLGPCRLQLLILQFRRLENRIIAYLFLFPIGQCIIGLPGRVDLLPAFVGSGHCSDSRNQRNDLLGTPGGVRGAGIVFVAALLKGVVVGIVEDDLVPVLQIPCGNAYLRMGAVDGIHPAGILSVVKFRKAVDPTDIYGAVLVVAVCIHAKIGILRHLL